MWSIDKGVLGKVWIDSRGYLIVCGKGFSRGDSCPESKEVPFP